MSKKRLINVVLALAILLILGTSAASGAPPTDEEMTYTVKLGDNLWTLAEKYLGSGPAYWAIASSTNVKYEEDTSFALIENPDLIHPGWKLFIPSIDEQGVISLPDAVHGGHDPGCALYCAMSKLHQDFDDDGVWEPWDADEDGKVELC
ncbi:MAG: LysM peptidoglycan-binding domain-containing protein, partial [Anaerolineae bacterium]